MGTIPVYFYDKNYQWVIIYHDYREVNDERKPRAINNTVAKTPKAVDSISFLRFAT